MLEKIRRIDQKVKILCVLLSHELLCTKLYYNQFMYFIYYLFQDMFKNQKIMKIQQVYQKIHTKQFLLFYLNCFLFVIHLNLKQLVKQN